MRISKFLQIGFFGSLALSPAMAQEAEKVHEEALRILRQKIAEAEAPTNTVVIPENPGLKVRPSLKRSREMEEEVNRARAERARRLERDAKTREAGRELKQEDRRQQFERDVFEREVLRQRQREYDEAIAKKAGVKVPQVNTMTPALPPTLATPAPATPVESAATANPVIAAEPANVSSIEEVHAKALELLHQAEAASVSSSSVSFSASPATTAPAQNVRTETPTITSPAATTSSTTSTATTTAVQPSSTEPKAPEASTRYRSPNEEAHARALEILRAQIQQGNTNPPPRTEPQAEPIPSPKPQSAAPAPSQPVAQPAPAQPSEPDRALQERAREILRQKQAEEAARKAQQPVTTSLPAVGPGSTDNNVPYSKRSEDRARQLLRERSANQTPSTATPAATPSVMPSQPTVAPSSADLQQRQQQALEILRQQEASLPRTEPPAASALDTKTKDIFRKQDEQIARQLHTTPAPVQKPTPPPSTIPAPVITPPPATVQTQPVITPAAPAAGQDEYARQLQARAQEILRQNQTPTPTIAPAPAPQAALTAPQTVTPNIAPPAATPTAPATSPVGTPPATTAPSDTDVAAVHAKALEALHEAETKQPPKENAAPRSAGKVKSPVQGNPPPAQPEVTAGPKTKKEKLADLNALYKGDKIGPAEYHERRAKILAEPE
jgi:hypothetical protein